MIKDLIYKYKHLENITYKIMKNGFKFSFLLLAISIIILLTYIFIFAEPFFYYAGIAIFKLSLTFCIEFLICGLVVDTIKKSNC